MSDIEHDAPAADPIGDVDPEIITPVADGLADARAAILERIADHVVFDGWSPAAIAAAFATVQGQKSAPTWSARKGSSVTLRSAQASKAPCARARASSRWSVLRRRSPSKSRS